MSNLRNASSDTRRAGRVIELSPRADTVVDVIVIDRRRLNAPSYLSPILRPRKSSDYFFSTPLVLSLSGTTQMFWNLTE